jgi:hypothetical protein
MVWGQNEQGPTAGFHSQLSQQYCANSQQQLRLLAAERIHVPPLILQVHLHYIQPVTTLTGNHSNFTVITKCLTVVLPKKTSGLFSKIPFQLPIPYLHMKQAQYYDEEHTATAISIPAF